MGIDSTDLGLGLIGGLEKGLLAYTAAKDRKADRQADLATRGLILTKDDSGNEQIIKSPESERDEKIKSTAGLMEHGLKLDPSDPRGVSFDPEWEARQLRLEQAKALANPLNNLSPAQKGVDTGFAKDYNDYQLQGGRSTVDKNLGLLKGAADKLTDEKGLTGNWTQKIPILNSDAIQSTINPDSIRVRDDIRGAVQASLRQTLGSQFTEREGEAIFNRAYDPKLAPEENVRRINNTLAELKGMAASKDQSGQYYEGHGTLKGFSPTTNRGLLNPVAPAQAGAETMGPRPGEVHDGYQFKGGNPADPKSWIQVK